jgi:hypothetical protein
VDDRSDDVVAQGRQRVRGQVPDALPGPSESCSGEFERCTPQMHLGLIDVGCSGETFRKCRLRAIDLNPLEGRSFMEGGLADPRERFMQVQPAVI